MPLCEAQIDSYESIIMSENSTFLPYLQELSMTSLTEIQTLCFEPLFEGKSVFGLAPTGSGKTLAFVLPLLLKVDCENRNIQQLILVPTRELGSQIARVCQQVSDVILALDKKNILTRSAFGGGPISSQIEELSKKPHVLIATPGRVIDLLERKAFEVKNIKVLILDEADMMVGMGFSEQVEIICHKLPRGLQIALFSATQNEKVTALEESLLKNTPHEVYNTKDSSTKNQDNKMHDSEVQHKFVFSSAEKKYPNLITFLQNFEADNSGKIILFCHQRETAHNLAEDLKKEGFNADALTGELGQIHRSSIMRNFKTGNLKYLVATNIVARGIDIDKLSAVIHYDVPFTQEDYIHRSGRTGRSGYSEGSSITFCDGRTKIFYIKLMEDLNIKPEEIKLTINKIAENREASKNNITENKINFFKVHINKGKQNKIRPGDIVGAFIQDLELQKEDIGSIFIFNNFTHIEVNIAKKKNILNKTFKVKNLTVKALEAE